MASAQGPERPFTKEGPYGTGPVRPFMSELPYGRLRGGAGLLTLSEGVGEGPDETNRREVNRLTRKLNLYPDPAAHRQQLAPGCPHPASLAPTGKNADLQRERCRSTGIRPAAKMPLPATADATTARKIPASPTVHCRGPVERDFPPFQLRTSYENTRLAKMPLASNRCTPQGRRVRDLQHGARRPPHMNALTGGYAGDSGGSNSVAALATTPTTQTDTR